jgi:undecaprenyl-phosphate galactose phosphotransferase
MRNYRSVLRVLSLLILDLIAFYAALFLAVFTRTFLFPFFVKESTTFGFTLSYFLSIWWVPLVYLAVFQFFKLYRVRYPFWEESRTILKAVTIASLFVFLTVFVRSMYGSISRLVFVFLWAAMIFATPFVRFFGKKLMYRIGLWRERVIILGAGESGVATLKGLAREEHLGYSVAGFLDDDPEKAGSLISFKGKDYKVFGSTDNFGKFVGILGIETVFIADTGQGQEKLSELVNQVYQEVKRVMIIPEIKGIAIFNSELHYLFMERLFLIKVNNNLNSLASRFVKRAFDLTLSILGFLATSPIYLVLALLVKLTSPGPVIFSHKRVGRGGKEFRAHKFRTMYRDSQERLKKILATDPKAREEWESSFKLKNDPRVTPLGKFLRATSLDEIPQIFNIIAGEMSLIGPRPVVQEELDKYYGDHREYYNSVTPGLTGLWQVSGRSNTDYAFRIETDAWYVQNWSLWLDMIILLKTVPAVLMREGAY